MPSRAGEIEQQPPPPKRTRPRRGEQLELTIDSFANGGAGVARHDGYVVFVEGAYPGDRVRASITKAKRDYANARTEDVIEASPDRVEQRCDHDGGPCPGSPWQQLRYEVQAAAKQDLVGEALHRLGGFDDFELEPIVPADPLWRYRNKMEYSFGTSPAGDSLALGFHARGRWDLIHNARDCRLASERSNRVRNLVRDWCDEEGLRPYDRRNNDGFLRNLVVRESFSEDSLQLRLVTGRGDFRKQALSDLITAAEPGTSLLWTQTAELAEVTRGQTTRLAGDTDLEEQVGGLRFRISPDAFFQTNTAMVGRLYGIATEYAGLEGRERVYDLYCGIGTLSLALSLNAGEVWAIDVTEPAIADAIENARLNEIDNVNFFAGDVRDAIRPLAERAPRPDVVVVDPPRAGLSKRVVRRLLELSPKRIVYVSCNATTLAPNARQIADAGYRLAKVRPVDMFPHTPHIECVARLERNAA